jgi:hypothetical protein
MIRNEMIRDNTNNVVISHKHDDSDGDAMMPQRQSPPPQTNMLSVLNVRTHTRRIGMLPGGTESHYNSRRSASTKITEQRTAISG